MGFLAPLFLAGLAALAVPVVLHLLRRESRDVVAYPSLMFLHRIPVQSVRRQRIRHWLLLAVRCLLLVLIATAFARPFLDHASRLGAGGPAARELVILLDRSYSMGHGDRWRRATAAAQRELRDLTTADRVTLVVFDEDAQAVTEPTSDLATVRAAIDVARHGPGVTRYGPAISLAGRILGASERPRREVVLITDFQRRGWEPRDAPRLPSGTTMRRVNVSGERTANAYVSGAEFRRETRGGREWAVVSARVTNSGAEALAAHPVSLDINGRTVETRTVSVTAAGSAMATFQPVALREGITRGTVRLAADALEADDSFHFTLSPVHAVSVLLVQRAGARPAESLYLRRALSVGDRPPFRVEAMTSPPTAQDLEGRHFVILNGVPWPAGDAGERLVRFVQRGGGVLVTAGERGAGVVESFTYPLAGTVGQVTDRTERHGGTVGMIDRQHPVFEPFAEMRGGGLASARFFRYRSVAPADSARVLARFDDGAPALLEREIGDGRVLLWASTFDNVWNDLPVHPAFLPFVHRLVLHGAHFTEARPWANVGETLDLTRIASLTRISAAAQPTGVRGSDEIVVRAPSGETIRPAAGRLAMPLAEQGFYELRRGGAASAPLHTVAVNLDPSESDLTSFDAEELALAIAPAEAPSGLAAGAGALSVAERERRAGLWWHILLVVALLLGVETILANRTGRRTVKGEVRTANGERRAANSEQRTANSEQWTVDSVVNSER